MSFNNYLKAFNKTLSASMFDHDDTPNYQLLSEQLTDDGEESPFAAAFTDESPINELSPAENTAQTWTRKSEDKNSDLYFTNLYSNAITKKAAPRVPQGVDISSLTPQDEWDAKFAKNQPLQTGTKEIKMSGPQGSGLVSGGLSKGQETPNPNPTKPGSYADRQEFAKRMKMSRTDYYNFFRRINAVPN